MLSVVLLGSSIISTVQALQNAVGGGIGHCPASRLPEELVVSTIFHSKGDPQRRKPSCRTCRTYFEPWLTSLKRLNIHALILHDGIPPSVVEATKGPLVEFCEVKLGPGSVNDERFRLYYALLSGQPVHLYPSMKIFPRDDFVAPTDAKKVIFTDAADVVFLKNPFSFLDSKKKRIFVGSENRKWIMWMRRKVKDCGLQDLPFERRLMYNAGILGGQVQIVLRFLHDFVTLQEKLSEGAYKRNCNMPIFNAVVKNWSRRGLVQTGYPLHTSFLAFQCNQSDAFICHK